MAESLNGNHDANEAASGASVLRAAAELRAERGIPDGDPSAWIRYQLSQRTNEATGKRWTQRAVANATHVAESSVSKILAGDRRNGFKVGRVRRLVCDILGVSELVLFGNLSSDTKAKDGETDNGG